MTAPLRSGGRAALPIGATIVWSVAEGARGRRWREAITIDGGLVRSLLLEVSTAGRPTRLEMTTAAGLLTLHPNRDDRELHGNVVTPAGIRHLRFEWSPDHELDVAGSPAAASVALSGLAAHLAVGDAIRAAVVRVDDDLVPTPATWQVIRSGPTTWQVRDTGWGGERTVGLDRNGLPELPDAETWPLQAD
jgi:hypothetical protein